MKQSRRELDLSRVDVSRFESAEDEETDRAQGDLEVEDLSPPTTPPPPAGHAVGDPLPLHPVLFVIGVVALLAGAALVGAALAGTWYTVDHRDGPQPPGDSADGSIQFHYAVQMSAYHSAVADADGTVVDSETEDIEAAPYMALAMARLRVALIVGMVLTGLGALAAVLHRTGVIVGRGAAPVGSTLAVVVWVLGLGVAAAQLAHHARLQWVPGRLDVDVAFFTFNADGVLVHDVTMLPGVAYWLAIGGVVATAVGVLVLHTRDVRAAWHAVRAAAQDAAAEAALSKETMDPAPAVIVADGKTEHDGAEETTRSG